MGKKKLQGADGMNFQLQLTIKGLESINLPEENLTNESGNDIMKISCWGGKLSAYVNLPNAIRPNNVQPFQLSDLQGTRLCDCVRRKRKYRMGGRRKWLKSILLQTTD